MSTTKPVVADSVTVSVVSDRHAASALAARLHDGELAEGSVERAHGGKRVGTVGQR